MIGINHCNGLQLLLSICFIDKMHEQLVVSSDRHGWKRQIYEMSTIVKCYHLFPWEGGKQICLIPLKEKKSPTECFNSEFISAPKFDQIHITFSRQISHRLYHKTHPSPPKIFIKFCYRSNQQA